MKSCPKVDVCFKCGDIGGNMKFRCNAGEADCCARVQTACCRRARMIAAMKCRASGGVAGFKCDCGLATMNDPAIGG